MQDAQVVDWCFEPPSPPEAADWNGADSGVGALALSERWLYAVTFTWIPEIRYQAAQLTTIDPMRVRIAGLPCDFSILGGVRV